MTLTKDDFKQIGALITETVEHVIEAKVNPRFDEMMEAMAAYSIRVEEQLNEIRADILDLRIEVRNLRQDVTDLQLRMTRVEEQLVILTERVDRLDSRTHEDATAAFHDISDLRKRVKSLEKGQQTLKKELNALTKP